MIDTASDLMWQQCGSEKSMNFEVTKKWIEDLNHISYRGYNDWRLPTLEEAMSLMEPTQKNAGLYINPRFDSKQMWIWTADLEKDVSRAWVLVLDPGNCLGDLLDYYGFV